MAATRGVYVLTLHGHSAETIGFSGRPQRQFGEVPTPRFFTGLGFLPTNPPNAALVIDLPGQPEAVILVELLNPRYEARTQTLTYEANLLHQYPNARGNTLAPVAARAHAQNLPAAVTFGAASLFIDDCPDGVETCWTAGSGGKCGDNGQIGFGNCWNWQTLSCNRCGSYVSQCNSQYPDCNNNCPDDIALCGSPGCCNGYCCLTPYCVQAPQPFYCQPSNVCSIQSPAS